MTTQLLNMAYELRGMKLGLEQMRAVHAKLGSPASAFECIHVGGTNGKGSTSLKIATALQESGKKVGLYTSPHIEDICERICINGEKISDLDSLIEPLLPLQLTYFETLTMAAFLAFKQERVDVAVIEVGLGGRLDATNIIEPSLCVITSIGWDHMAYLGNTLEAIAREKAGIIKPGVPVVIGPHAQPRCVFEEKADSLIVVEGEFPHFEAENQAIAKAALHQLGVTPSGAALSKCPPCRFERWGDAILDVAHNLPGLEALFKRARALERPLRVVAAFSADKATGEMLAFLRTQTEHLHLTQADHPRALSLGPKGVKETVLEAYGLARAGGELLVVCGTFFMMASARSAMRELSLSIHGE